MASISSLLGSSSSSSSIYGSRNSNIISGLASGLDTESMIEGMVESYKQKILGLQQDRTKLQWQQDAYQSISDKLVEFSRKYTSYGSTTNLFSSGFFNNSVITTPKGQYADLVTASGKSSSQVVLNGVKQLATNSRYSSSAVSLGAQGTVAKGDYVDLSAPMTLSKMSGSLTLTYGTQNITLEFGETEDLANDDGTLDTAKFQKALEDKLAELELKNQDGDQVSASELIGVSVSSDGTVTLSNKASGGDSVFIKGATGDFSGMVSDLSSAVADEKSVFTMKTDVQVADRYVSKADYLSGKSFSVTLNGQTKTITLGEISLKDGQTWNEAARDAFQQAVDGAFGKMEDGSSRVQVQVFSDPTSFGFQVQQGDTFSISSVETGVGELIFGEGNDQITSYLDVGKTLGDLLGSTGGRKIQGEGSPVLQEDGTYLDEAGNKVDKDGYLIHDDGSYRYEYDVEINGVKIGTYQDDTALETVINDINSNSSAGVNVTYSKLTNEFVLTAKQTGAAQQIRIGEQTADGTENLAAKLFGATVDENGDVIQSENYTSGQDAVFVATVNGKTTTYTRSTNSVDLDGLTVTLDGTFNVNEEGNLIDENESVTFSSKTDTDTIVDAIKQMVEDYNAMVTEVKKAYSDMPLQQSSGAGYEPLTAEDEAEMSESEIEAYEEKAKTGILFMDRDLSSLYSALRSAVVPSGADGSYLRSIGIETSYEDGLTTISLDEEALRQALESDLDGVKNAFTKSKEYGSSTDGLMASIQKVTDRYAATTGAVKGILIEKAGSQYSPTATLDNEILSKMEEIDTQISKWQDKMSDKVDYYTNKFTQLEMLINQMNSQSSALAGLTG